MKQQGFVQILVLVVGILLGVLGYVYYLNKSTRVKTTSETVFKPCNISGNLSKEEYLPSYTVKEGDTLLNISKNILGDTSRVEEIIKLNNDTYPQLSLSNPFIEKGWKLKLPPENSSKTNGLIFVVGGKLSISDSGWGVSWLNAGVGPFSSSQLPSNFSSGDCVVVIYQGNDIANPSSLKVYSVTPSN